MPTFTPPSVLEPVDITERSFFALLRINKGETVLKTGTSYVLVRNPTEEQVTAADIAYLGGHTYDISAGEADALTAAGYGSGVTP